MNRSLNQQQQPQGQNFYRQQQQQPQQPQQPQQQVNQVSPTNTNAVLPTSKWGGSQQSPISPSALSTSSPQQQQQQYNQFNNNNTNLRRSSEYNNTNNYNTGNSIGQQQLNGSHKGVGTIVGSGGVNKSLSSSNSGIQSSNGSGGNSLNSSSSNLNKTKYSKDELLNLYDPNVKIPEPLSTHTYILSEEIQPPINLNYDSKRDRSNRLSQGGTPNMMNRMNNRKDMSGGIGGKPKWTNSPSSVAPSWRLSKDQIDSGDKKIWYYLDPQNNTQGPFSSLDMDSWHNGGYFKPDLLVKRGEGGFVKFKKLISHYGGTAPFTSITNQVDFQKLLKEPSIDESGDQSITSSITPPGMASLVSNSKDEEDLDEQIQPPVLESDENDLLMKFKQTVNLSSEPQPQPQPQPPQNDIINILLERTISPSQQIQQQGQQQLQQPSLLQSLQQTSSSYSESSQPQQQANIWEDDHSKISQPQQPQPQQPQQPIDNNWELMRSLQIQQQIHGQIIQTQNNMQQLSQQYQQLNKQPQTQQTQLQLQQILQYIQQQQQNHFTLQQQFYQIQLQNHMLQRSIHTQPQVQQQIKQQQAQQQQQQQPQQPGFPFFQQAYNVMQQPQQYQQQFEQQQQIQEPVVDQVEETDEQIVQEPKPKVEPEVNDNFIWGKQQQQQPIPSSPLQKSPLLSVNQEPLPVYDNPQLNREDNSTISVPEPELQVDFTAEGSSTSNGFAVSLSNPWTQADPNTKKKSILQIQQEEMKEQKRKEIEDQKHSTTEAKQQQHAMKWGGSIPTWSVDSSQPSYSFKDIQNEDLASLTKKTIEDPQPSLQQPSSSFPTLSTSNQSTKVSFSDVMKEQSKEKKVSSPQVNTQPKPVFNPSSPWEKPIASATTTTTSTTSTPNNSYNSSVQSNSATSKSSLSIRTDDLNTKPTTSNNSEFSSTTINILPKQSNSSIKTNSTINIKTKQQQQQSTYSITPRPDFIKWCHQQLKSLTTMDVNVVTELLCSLKSEDEIRECVKDCLGYSTETERFIGEYLLYRSDEPSLSFESSSPVITIPMKNKGSKATPTSTVSNKSKGKKK